MYIKDLLRKGEIELNSANMGESNLKTKLLLSNLLGVNKEYLLIHDLENVSKNIEQDFFEGINRLKNGEPLQYIIEKQEFYGLEFFVNNDVLIPQPDTEILVQEVLDIIRNCYSSKKLKILDLCTGSGAIAISLKKVLQNNEIYEDNSNDCSEIQVFASDISEKALQVAKINAEKNEVNINFIKSDLFESIDGKFDIIVSNPPYIESGSIENLPQEVKKEPKLALDGGEDGLEFYREIACKGRMHLKSNGIIAVEIGYNQKDEVIKIFKENNYKEIYYKKDFGQNDRIIVAKI